MFAMTGHRIGRFSYWDAAEKVSEAPKASDGGRPSVLRSHLEPDSYILMDRLSITRSNPGSHDYDNPGQPGEIICHSGLARDPPPPLRFRRSAPRARRKHSRSFRASRNGDTSSSCLRPVSVTALRPGTVSRKQNGYEEKTNNE